MKIFIIMVYQLYNPNLFVEKITFKLCNMKIKNDFENLKVIF